MTSLSNVIKAGIQSTEVARVIGHKPIHNQIEEGKLIQLSANQVKSELEQLLEEKQRLEHELVGLRQLTEETKREIELERNKIAQEQEQWWQEQQRELETLTEQAFEQANQRGIEEGYQQGYQQIQEELAVMKNELQTVVQAGYEHKERIIQDAEPFLLHLSVKMAKKIIQQELQTSEEQILVMIQEALKQVKESGTITIEVAIEHYPLLLAHLDELEQYLDGRQELKVIPADLQQIKQGCLIHTPKGSYDVTIDHQLEELKKQLLSLYEESVSE